MVKFFGLTLLKHLDVFVPILTIQTNEYFHLAIPYCIYKKEFTVESMLFNQYIEN